MDDFGCFDYKTPLRDQQDLRTSTYRGHRYITDINLGNKINTKYSDKFGYEGDPTLLKLRTTEYRQNYEWQYNDPENIRNPSLNMKMQNIKPFEECKLRFIKRPMKPQTSVSHQDYAWRPVQRIVEQPATFLPTAVAAKPMIIDRAKAGFTKNLDTSATTSNLAYVHYTPQQIQGGIGANDNITFWNWEAKCNKTMRVTREADVIMCDNLPTNLCPKRRCEYRNVTKHVPNSGLITEVRQNYLDPKYRSDFRDFDTTEMRNLIVHTPIIPFAQKTEYKLYGSSEQTRTYV